MNQPLWAEHFRRRDYPDTNPQNTDMVCQAWEGKEDAFQKP